MARKTFYIPGRTDLGSDLYNDESLYDRIKIFICDSVSDIPATMSKNDLCFITDGTGWVGHNVGSSWPVGSVIILVPDTDPAELLGFGDWVLVNQDVLPAHVWRRKE